jgi:quercetin dioxygenase-like cupin family protein
MFKLLVSALFIMSVMSIAAAQDATKVDGNHYKVEFENDEVRVLRVKVGPNEKSVMHAHPNAVAIFMTDVNGRFTFPNAPAQDISRKAGDVLWTPATVHLPENIGDKAFEVILVELKPRPAKRGMAKKGTRKSRGALAVRR